jgi:hypothetical protein
MNTKTRKSQLKMEYRILGYIGALFLAGISVLMLYTVWEEWNQASGMADSIWLYSSLLLFLFILIGSVFAIFYFSTGSVLAGEDALIKETLRGDIKISYSNIESVTISVYVITFKGNGSKITIGSAYTDFESFNAYIAEKIRRSGTASGKGIYFYLDEFLEDYQTASKADEAGSISIHLHRKSEWLDFLRSYEIILDGVQIGILKRGECKEIKVTPGEHEMSLHIDWCSSNSVSFTARDEDLKFECGNNVKGLRVLYSFLYITIWRNDHLWLKKIA